MSGKRMVSSVTITLAPPWRAEVSRKDPRTNQQAEPEQRRRATPPATPPDLRPPPEEFWSDQEDLQNGGLPAFPPTFLDDFPPEDDCLSPDLPPPPPPPPVHTKTPKRIVLDTPPPALPPDALSLELEKLELAYPTSRQKPAPATGPVKPQSLPTTTQQKREEPAPGKQNGYNGRSEGTVETCAFCHKAILPSTATIEAMKKHYHAGCFTCRKCHRLLAGQMYYQKDGQPICEHCHKDTLEKCATCQTLIVQHIVRAMGDSYHPECFRCVVCHRTIADESFAVDEYNHVHCAEDYYRKYAPICSVCDQPIIPKDEHDSYKIECIGRSFHEDCYRCEKCQVLLSLDPTESGCYPLNGHILCKSCHLSWNDELS